MVCNKKHHPSSNRKFQPSLQHQPMYSSKKQIDIHHNKVLHINQIKLSEKVAFIRPYFSCGTGNLIIIHPPIIQLLQSFQTWFFWFWAGKAQALNTSPWLLLGNHMIIIRQPHSTISTIMANVPLPRNKSAYVIKKDLTRSTSQTLKTHCNCCNITVLLRP